MRVMISEPMRELTEEQIREEKRKVVTMLEQQGHEIWEGLSEKTPIPPGVNQDLWRLGRRFLNMAGTDAVYFMDGWEKDRQCRLEYEAASAFDTTALGVAQPFFNKLCNEENWEKLECIVKYKKIGASGRFLLDKDKKMLLCVYTKFEPGHNQTGNDEWHIFTDRRDIFINPEANCIDERNRRRFVNNASCLFYILRNLLEEKNIPIVDKNYFGDIRYQLDNNGRYEILGYKENPIASLYAAAAGIFI